MEPLTVHGSPAAAPPRASRWETLGAWLHIWTPPRDVVVPEPPSARRLALYALGALVLLAGALAIAVPRIDGAKDDRAARERAADIAQTQARIAQARRLQRAGFASAAAAAVPAQLREARAAILADARARHRAGELAEPIGAVTCAPAAGSARPGLLRYSCVAATHRLQDLAAGPQRNLGYPFSLVLDPASGRFAWCRTLPVPAEGSTARSGVRVPQPAACRGDADPVP